MSIAPGVVNLFQSHAGSIEARRGHEEGRGVDRRFQSHAGSIEAQAGDLQHPLPKVWVSIPRWFD